MDALIKWARALQQYMEDAILARVPPEEIKANVYRLIAELDDAVQKKLDRDKAKWN